MHISILFIIFIFKESVDEVVKEKTDTTEIDKTNDSIPEEDTEINEGTTVKHLN